MTALHARAFQSGDTPALTAILNTIIAAGGTTGYEVPFTPEALRLRHFDEGKPVPVPGWTPTTDEDRRLAEYALQVMALSKGIEETVARYREAGRPV